MTIATRLLADGTVSVLQDGRRIGTMMRAVRPVACRRRGERLCRGFLVVDLKGAEIAWGSSYRSAVQRALHVLDVRAARARLSADPVTGAAARVLGAIGRAAE